MLMLLPMLKKRLGDKEDRHFLDAVLTSANFIENFISNVLVCKLSHHRIT
jgi:hypothetical protein